MRSLRTQNSSRCFSNETSAIESETEGKIERCRRERAPLLPTKEKPGEKSKEEKQQITFLINKRQQTAKIPQHMEEFRLGGVESGLVTLCHMVSLIAIFFQRYTKRDA